jgi:hypothetical protein
MKPPLAAVPLVDQVLRPECIEAAGQMPQLDPRPMPRLPRSSAARCYRMPLWRLFEKLGD